MALPGVFPIDQDNPIGPRAGEDVGGEQVVVTRAGGTERKHRGDTPSQRAGRRVIVRQRPSAEWTTAA